MDGYGTLVLRDVLLPGGRVADVTLRDERVIHVGSSGRSDQVISCRDMIVIPAGVDMHVHMRDGPQAAKEDWKTGTMSALAGGVTMVVDQPNTSPPLLTPDRIRERVAIAKERACCRFGINAGVTAGSDLTGCWKEGAMAFGETFAGPSSYGEAVSLPVLEHAMEKAQSLGALLTIHAEIVDDGEDENLVTHDLLRSPQNEEKAVRTVQNLNTAGCRLHFCHLSSARALRAVTGATREVTPHHLFLSRDRFDPGDTHGRVNPPLRSEEERRKLAACWDLIDVIASDHAPHTRTEKDADFPDASSGLPGTETMIPLLMAAMITGSIDLPGIIAKTVTTPSQILSIPPAGFEPTDRPDFAVYPREISRVEVDSLHSKAGWTPFEGHDAVFPRYVILGGRVVYGDHEFAECRGDWIRGRGYLTPGEI